MKKQPAAEAIKVLQIERAGNKTHLKIQTPKFTRWFWLPGCVDVSDAVALLLPTINRMITRRSVRTNWLDAFDTLDG